MNVQRRSGLKKSNADAFENFLLAKYERLAGIARTRSYPYVLTIDPTNICQLRCPACYTGMTNERLRTKRIAKTDRPPARLSSGVLDSIFEECGDLLFYCHFYNWGEPFLNPNLADFIRAAHARDIYTKVDSNLSLQLSDEAIEAVLLSGLSELSASIDGFSQATYEKYRIGGRFDLARDNIERFAAARARLGVPLRLKWKCLIYSFNEHELGDIAAFCEARDIEFLPAEAVILGEHSDWIPSYRREGKPNPYAVPRSRDASTTPAGHVPLYPGRPNGRTCAWHYSYGTVNADGGVAACCGLYRQTSDFGRVTAEKGSFGKTWHGGNFEIVRRDFPGGAETHPNPPTTACTRCTRSEAFRDHYTSLDRAVIFRYWSLDEGSRARQLDPLFRLLQTSPTEFAAAYAPRYDAIDSMRVLETEAGALDCVGARSS